MYCCHDRKRVFKVHDKLKLLLLPLFIHPPSLHEFEGIVGNTMFDPSFNESFSIFTGPGVRDPKWWTEADPIWLDHQRAGGTSAVYFWPGSEVGVPVRRVVWGGGGGRACLLTSLPIPLKGWLRIPPPPLHWHRWRGATLPTGVATAAPPPSTTAWTRCLMAD